MERIPYEKTKEENSVEILFAKKFEELKKHKMDDETSKLMIQLTLAPIPDNDEEMNGQFLCQIVTKRFEALGYTMDIKTKLFLAVLTGSPGTAVMYCHYLAYFCKTHKISHLTFSDFCMQAFPWGFPSDEDLSKLWDEQKVHRNMDQPGTDNLLDYFYASKSIMSQPEPATDI
jgi:hypothetical protein